MFGRFINIVFFVPSVSADVFPIDSHNGIAQFHPSSNGITISGEPRHHPSTADVCTVSETIVVCRLIDRCFFETVQVKRTITNINDDIIILPNTIAYHANIGAAAECTCSLWDVRNVFLVNSITPNDDLV